MNDHQTYSLTTYDAAGYASAPLTFQTDYAPQVCVNDAFYQDVGGKT